MAHPEGEQPTDLGELMEQMGGLDGGLVGDDGELVEPLTQAERLKKVDRDRESIYLMEMERLKELREAIGTDTVTFGTGDERVLVFWRPMITSELTDSHFGKSISQVEYLILCKEGFFTLIIGCDPYIIKEQGSVGNFLSSSKVLERASDFELEENKYDHPIIYWHDLLKQAAISNGQINQRMFEFKGRGVEEHLVLSGVSKWGEKELKRIENLKNSRLIQERYVALRSKMKELEKRTREEIAFVSGEDALEEVAEKPKRKNEERRNWFQSIWWRIWGRR